MRLPKNKEEKEFKLQPLVKCRQEDFLFLIGSRKLGPRRPPQKSFISGFRLITKGRLAETTTRAHCTSCFSCSSSSPQKLPGALGGNWLILEDALGEVTCTGWWFGQGGPARWFAIVDSLLEASSEKKLHSILRPFPCTDRSKCSHSSFIQRPDIHKRRIKVRTLQ